MHAGTIADRHTAADRCYMRSPLKRECEQLGAPAHVQWWSYVSTQRSQARQCRARRCCHAPQRSHHLPGHARAHHALPAHPDLNPACLTTPTAAPRGVAPSPCGPGSVPAWAPPDGDPRGEIGAPHPLPIRGDTAVPAAPPARPVAAPGALAGVAGEAAAPASRPSRMPALPGACRSGSGPAAPRMSSGPSHAASEGVACAAGPAPLLADR